jgi:hypothetical protein
MPTVAFEQTLLKLAGAAGDLAETTEFESSDVLANKLHTIFELLVAAANEAGITLAAAANANVQQIAYRWPRSRVPPALFDEGFPPEEQLPRHLKVDIFEREAKNGRNYVIQRCNGILIGDRLTDNIMMPDDYRFHDVFHYAYAAILVGRRSLELCSD